MAALPRPKEEIVAIVGAVEAIFEDTDWFQETPGFPWVADEFRAIVAADTGKDTDG